LLYIRGCCCYPLAQGKKQGLSVNLCRHKTVPGARQWVVVYADAVAAHWHKKKAGPLYVQREKTERHTVFFTCEEKQKHTDACCCCAVRRVVYSKNHSCGAYISSVDSSRYWCVFRVTVRPSCARCQRWAVMRMHRAVRALCQTPCRRTSASLVRRKRATRATPRHWSAKARFGFPAYLSTRPYILISCRMTRLSLCTWRYRWLRPPGQYHIRRNTGSFRNIKTTFCKLTQLACF